MGTEDEGEAEGGEMSDGDPLEIVYSSLEELLRRQEVLEREAQRRSEAWDSEHTDKNLVIGHQAGEDVVWLGNAGIRCVAGMSENPDKPRKEEP